MKKLIKRFLLRIKLIFYKHSSDFNYIYEKNDEK